MLNDVLAVSAALVGLATVVLLLAGRRTLPGYPLRIVLLALLLFLVGVALGWIDPLALHRAVPSPGNPVSIVGLATLTVALLTPRRWWAVGSITFSSLVVATALYLAYLVQVTIVLAISPLSLLLGVVLLLFQAIALVLMVASVFEMVDSLCRPIEVYRLPDPPATWPTVVFQVPVHQEPPDLVAATVRSLIAVDYPRERLVVQVIDNNTTDPGLWQPLRAECEALAERGWRVEFSHLEDWPGYKAGALNYGLAHLPPDARILAIVDSDYVVEPGFLKATIPYFRDPSIAFVQTPQEYRAWSRSGFYRACHTGFEYFFRVGMISRGYRNSIIFAGTMGLIRREALDRIGGWDEAVITEDAEASLRLLALGYRSVYVPVPYGRGIMPLTYEGLRSQRFRWAFGGMQILRKHWRSLMPWAHSGLTQRQRRDYLLGGLGWLNDAMTFGFWAFIAATAIGYLTGHPFVVQALAGLGLVLPSFYILLGIVRYVWGLRVATGVDVTEAFVALRVNLSLSWVVTLALVRGAIEEHGVFLRTPKFRGDPSVRALRVVWVEALLGLASAVLFAEVLLWGGLSILALTVGALLAWSALTYGSAVEFALGDPTRPPEALREKATLERFWARTAAANRAPALGAAAAVGLAIVALAAAVLAESAQPPVPGYGAALPPPRVAQAPSPTPSSSAQRPSSSPTPTPTATPATGSSPTSTATPTPGTSATPAPSRAPTPSPSPTPATVLSTPSPAPSGGVAPPTPAPSLAPRVSSPTSTPAA